MIRCYLPNTAKDQSRFWQLNHSWWRRELTKVKSSFDNFSSPQNFSDELVLVGLSKLCFENLHCLQLQPTKMESAAVMRFCKWNGLRCVSIIVYNHETATVTWPIISIHQSIINNWKISKRRQAPNELTTLTDFNKPFKRGSFSYLKSAGAQLLSVLWWQARILFHQHLRAYFNRDRGYLLPISLHLVEPP